ncbi:uncharacterized protein BDZ83DRAFT_650226 [Colletotrichum acutatum]|uniref:Uncharacterized protein n=1 Tax=Glomerella acutata TaxID=27357 RepID=A0AAD8UNR2_GLOAC|nr:uncharacterized protein BDZ83DRAFT_650226 [Colletotrichum acutatum]KAK1726738.1 hypothetical protein BDZ83DRAFT_650226 [Colletotrichum acutatum]
MAAKTVERLAMSPSGSAVHFPLRLFISTLPHFLDPRRDGAGAGRKGRLEATRRRVAPGQFKHPPRARKMSMGYEMGVTVWLGSLLGAHHGRGIVPGSVEGRSQAEHLLILGPPDYPALIKSE